MISLARNGISRWQADASWQRAKNCRTQFSRRQQRTPALQLPTSSGVAEGLDEVDLKVQGPRRRIESLVRFMMQPPVQGATQPPVVFDAVPWGAPAGPPSGSLTVVLADAAKALAAPVVPRILAENG